MEIKQKLIKELENLKIPDLKFLFSKEVLDSALKILEELLEEEKKEFDEKINTKYLGLDSEVSEKTNLKWQFQTLSFDTFQDFSKLDLFYDILNHFKNVKSNEKLREIIENFEPKYIDFANYMAFNKRYYDMLVYCRKNNNLDNEQKRILNLSIERFEVRWINLDKIKQKNLKEINKKLSDLSIKFSNNLLDSRKEFSYLFENIWDINELPENDLKEAKNRAEKVWKKWYLFDASDSSYMSIMKYCKNPEIRKYFYTEKNNFASSWKYSNKKIVLEILKLRQKKAKILGFKNYAELSMVFKMAESPESVLDLIKSIAKKAKKKAKQEIKTLEKYFKIVWIQSWDLAYYNRIYKEKKFEFDEKELKNYFEFNHVLNWLFEITEKLYWIKMKKIEINSYSDDLMIYEVYKDKEKIWYFLGDYFYNKNKQQWAWCDNLRPKFIGTKNWVIKAEFNHDSQDLPLNSKFSVLPILVNVCNFQKEENWKTLLNYIDVETMFHEFWHAIHELLTKSKYSELSWHQVEWDFVELPSQIMQNWSEEQEALDLFAKHFETWKKIPKKIIKSIEKLKLYWNGNFVIRQNEFAIMDLLIHTKKSFQTTQELDNYILKIINKYSPIKKEDNYNMYASFSHLFAWWYGAWYYSYMRAEIIEKQVWNEFEKHWIFHKKTAQKFLETILSAWTTKPAKELFYDFLWQDIKIDAFLKSKWFKKN